MKKNIRIKKKSNSSRYRKSLHQEVPNNFFKLKMLICLLLFTTVVVIDQLNINIGNFSSDDIFNKLYYNQDITKMKETFLNFDIKSLEDFWNNQK